MGLTVAAGAKPVFLSKNYVNQDCIDYGTFLASENDTLLDRIIDGDPDSYWSDSSATDGTTVTITIQLMDGGVQAERSIDFLLFQNINWRRFRVQYSLNTSPQTWVTFTGADYTAADYSGSYFRLAPAAAIASVAWLRIEITHTQTANAAKRLGGLFAALKVLQPSYGDIKAQPNYRENTTDQELGNGNLSRDLQMRSATSHMWWGCECLLPQLPKTEVDTLYGIKRDGLPFVYYPQPYNEPETAYLCVFANEGWGPRPSTKKYGTFDVPYRLMEVRALA